MADVRIVISNKKDIYEKYSGKVKKEDFMEFMPNCAIEIRYRDNEILKGEYSADAKNFLSQLKTAVSEDNNNEMNINEENNNANAMETIDKFFVLYNECLDQAKQGKVVDEKHKQEMEELYNDASAATKVAIAQLYYSHRILHDGYKKVGTTYRRGARGVAQDVGRFIGNVVYGGLYTHASNVEMTEKNALEVLVAYNEARSRLNKLDKLKLSNEDKQAQRDFIFDDIEKLAKEQVESDDFKDTNWREHAVDFTSATIKATDRALSLSLQAAAPGTEVAKRAAKAVFSTYRNARDIVFGLGSTGKKFYNLRKLSKAELADTLVGMMDRIFGPTRDIVEEGYDAKRYIKNEGEDSYPKWYKKLYGDVKTPYRASTQIIWAVALAAQAGLAYYDAKTPTVVAKMKKKLTERFEKVVNGKEPKEIYYVDEYVRNKLNNELLKKNVVEPLQSYMDLNLLHNKVKNELNGKENVQDDASFATSIVNESIFSKVDELLKHYNTKYKDNTDKINKALKKDFPNGIRLKDFLKNIDLSKNKKFQEFRKKIAKDYTEKKLGNVDWHDIVNENYDNDNYLRSIDINVEFPEAEDNFEKFELSPKGEDELINGKEDLKELDAMQQHYVRLRMRRAFYYEEKQFLKSKERDPEKYFKNRLTESIKNKDYHGIYACLYYFKCISNKNELVEPQQFDDVISRLAKEARTVMVRPQVMDAIKQLKNDFAKIEKTFNRDKFVQWVNVKTKGDKVILEALEEPSFALDMMGNYENNKMYDKLMFDDYILNINVNKLAYLASDVKNLERENSDTIDIVIDAVRNKDLNQESANRLTEFSNNAHKRMHRLVNDDSKMLNNVRRAGMQLYNKQKVERRNLRIHSERGRRWNKFAAYAFGTLTAVTWGATFCTGAKWLMTLGKAFLAVDAVYAGLVAAYSLIYQLKQHNNNKNMAKRDITEEVINENYLKREKFNEDLKKLDVSASEKDVRTNISVLHNNYVGGENFISNDIINNDNNKSISDENKKRASKYNFSNDESKQTKSVIFEKKKSPILLGKRVKG